MNPRRSKCRSRGSGEGLRVGVDRGSGILPQDSLRAPVPRNRPRPGYIHCLPYCRRLAVTEDNSDEVIWAGRVVALLHGRGDLVVGLGDHLRGGDPLQVVAKRAKGKYVSHRETFDCNKLGRSAGNARQSGDFARLARAQWRFGICL